LVQRIAQMHDDRVSTPDILGILEGSRIDEVLGRIDSPEAGEAAGRSLVKLFEAWQQEFAYQAYEIAPFLLTESPADTALPFANAVTSDPILEDDAAFERFMLDALHGGVRSGRLPGTYRLDVPRHFQGAAVEPRYECATFRRSVATQYPASEAEFVHRLHPLSRAVAQHAFEELTLAPAQNGTSSRIAVRRHSLAAERAFALFTYLDRQTHPGGMVYGVAVDAEGQILDRSVPDILLAGDDRPLGEVNWNECERVFRASFASMQQAAASAARDLLGECASLARTERVRTASVLREEAALYRVDRLAEIDADEQAERAGAQQQLQLFRDAATNWQARRAAVHTNYQRRLEEIERFAQVPEPPEPQPLGVLLVFPPA
jgi:hypothetical protein